MLHHLTPLGNRAQYGFKKESDTTVPTKILKECGWLASQLIPVIVGLHPIAAECSLRARLRPSLSLKLDEPSEMGASKSGASSIGERLIIRNSDTRQHGEPHSYLARHGH